LASFFDAPIPDPPEMEPFNRFFPFVTGQTPKDLAGQPAHRLVAKLGSPEWAREMVAFGCLWMMDKPQPDPDGPLEAGARFRVNWPRYGPKRFYEADPKRIVFEDPDILIYDKESGRPAQSVPHDNYNNAQAALERLRNMPMRLAHRLDVGTSGFLIMAKNAPTASRLGQAFSQGRVSKLYLALTLGEKPDWVEKTVTAYVAKSGQHYVARAEGPGKLAKTILRVIKAQDGQILWAARPLTGRTHQIRLHLDLQGYPILGDNFYGGAAFSRLALRAAGLRVTERDGRDWFAIGPLEPELQGLWP
jgi:23S rRNA-/tRNA-specific pseudouridylate synthase